jgi:anti-anti-sigma factor
MRLLDFRLQAAEGIVYAKLSGDVDLSNADQLGEELTTMTPNDALGVIIDLSDVGYLDSAGIHLIHRLREDLRARAQMLRLVIPGGSPVIHTLRLAGLSWDEEIVETADAARDAFAAS